MVIIRGGEIKFVQCGSVSSWLKDEEFLRVIAQIGRIQNGNVYTAMTLSVCDESNNSKTTISFAEL